MVKQTHPLAAHDANGLAPMTATRDWVSWKDYIILVLVFALMPFVSHAGGLGIAAIVGFSGLMGIVGLRLPWPRDIPSSVPAAFWVLMLLLVYGVASTFWSPYVSNNTFTNAEKMFLGVPLYLGCGAIILEQRKYSGKTIRILEWLLIGGTIGSGLAIFLDVSTGYGLTLTLDPLPEGEDLNVRRGDIVQNLGHAVSVLTLLTAPVSVMLWQKQSLGKIGAIALVTITTICAWKTGMNACLIALVAMLLFMFFATRAPKKVLRLGFLCAGLSLLFAPILALVAGQLSAETRAGLPFSWEERVATWDYMYHKILEHPWFGNGFDAVRTFNETHTIRGFEDRALVSLHPHNAGLHLWAELGLVGVALACLVLFFGVRRLTGYASLSKPKLIASSGLCIAIVIMAGFSYGVWQDWWWASIIFAGAVISFIKD